MLNPMQVYESHRKNSSTKFPNPSQRHAQLLPTEFSLTDSLWFFHVRICYPDPEPVAPTYGSGFCVGFRVSDQGVGVYSFACSSLCLLASSTEGRRSLPFQLSSPLEAVVTVLTGATALLLLVTLPMPPHCCFHYCSCSYSYG